MPQRLLPVDGTVGNDLANQVATHQPGAGLGLGHQAAVVQVDGREDALHGPLDPQPADQRPGVDPFQPHHAIVGEVVVQLAVGAKIARPPAPLANNETGQVRPGAFHVLGVNAVVADFGVGHGDHLPPVTGVGEDFLIARHRGIETNLAVHLAFGAEGLAGENRTIFQSKFRGLRHGAGSWRSSKTRFG